MKIIILLITIFIALFLLVFSMIYKGEKREIKAKKRKIFPAIGAAFILASAPTLVFGAVLFLLFGSVSFVNITFLLDISTNQLAFLVIAFFIYLYTIDNIVEFATNYILGEHIFNLIIVLLIRILAFYTIGLMFNLNQTSNLIITSAVSSITFFIEILKLSKK